LLPACCLPAAAVYRINTLSVDDVLACFLGFFFVDVARDLKIFVR